MADFLKMNAMVRFALLRRSRFALPSFVAANTDVVVTF